MAAPAGAPGAGGGTPPPSFVISKDDKPTKTIGVEDKIAAIKERLKAFPTPLHPAQLRERGMHGKFVELLTCISEVATDLVAALPEPDAGRDIMKDVSKMVTGLELMHQFSKSGLPMDLLKQLFFTGALAQPGASSSIGRAATALSASLAEKPLQGFRIGSGASPGSASMGGSYSYQTASEEHDLREASRQSLASAVGSASVESSAMSGGAGAGVRAGAEEHKEKPIADAEEDAETQLAIWMSLGVNPGTQVSSAHGGDDPV